MEETLQSYVKIIAEDMVKMKPHLLPNHVQVFGTNGTDTELMPFVVVLNALVAPQEAQAQGFGIMLKQSGIQAKLSILIINGHLPDHRLHPMSIILGMSRSGDYHQVVVDFTRKEILPSENINEEDKAVCASVFLGQVNYKPELSDARFN